MVQKAADARVCMFRQTEEVYKRKHAYRTEVFQIQDHFINEKKHVNQALIGHAAVAIIQSTAARVGMFAKFFFSKKWPSSVTKL